MSKTAFKVLLSPFFVLGLFLLLLNDLYLKAAYGNFLTGKLSDVAGLFIFPLFFSAFFPKRRILIYFLTGFAFIFWKSPFSDPMIGLFNSLEFFRIGRTVDAADLAALLILPVSYWYLGLSMKTSGGVLTDMARRFAAMGMIFLSVFAFTATTLEDDRHVTIRKIYALKGTIADLESDLKKIGSLSQVKFRSYDETFPGSNNPDQKQMSHTYFGDFTLRRSYCESDKLEVNLLVDQVKETVMIEMVGFRFWCKEKPTEKDEADLLGIFESEVINKLGPKDSQ